ncbi:MAG: glutamate--tRNA ligase [Candidatus Jacksonbacteria bacterium]
MITTRFAPSPTGAPHIGNIRTAIFAWVYARSQNGKFLLRIEDTDKAREVDGSVGAILESLKWIGLDVDETQNSKLNPASLQGQNYNSKLKTKEYNDLIFQSQRLAIYQKYAEELVKNGHAYVCVCSEERLKKLRENQIKVKQPPMYDGYCRNNKCQMSNMPHRQSAEEANAKSYVVRLKVPHEGQTEFPDIIRGKVSFENKLIDDQVLLKSDGYPTYHLANVVDDHLMGVTHVLRAEEWLSSTPKHLLLYKFFDWKPPQFAHLPMILGPDRSKLSKRHGAVSLLEYKKQGYLPEAIFNYLILLGWRPKTDQEIFSQLEIIKQFSLERVQKSPAIFDQGKLDWINGWYIRQMPAQDLLNRLIEYGQKFDENKMRANKIVKLVQDRMRTLSDFAELSKFIVNLPDYESSLLIFKKTAHLRPAEEIKKSLTASLKLLQNISESKFTKDNLQSAFKEMIDAQNLSIGQILHPLRVALTGLKNSPGPFETAEALGKAESVIRVKLALEKSEEM